MYDEKLLFDVPGRRYIERLGLRDIYGSRQWDIREEVEERDSARLLATDDADIVQDLLARHSIVCPVLHREQAEQLPPGQHWLMTRLVITVPFDGDAALFQVVDDEFCHAQAKSGDTKKGELFLAWSDDTSNELAPEAVGRDFHFRLDKIERQLSALGPGIARANTDLAEWVTARIASLRAGLQWQAELGIPVRQRADAAQFEVPLSDEHYEQVLAELSTARNGLERSQKMTAPHGENELRDMLLLFLNGRFKGAAVGEAFNKTGKTDILIRVEDRNIFIAECKIWDGPSKFHDAIDQLLGYLTWPDTSAALVLFIRKGEPSSIIPNAIAEITRHRSFVRTSGAGKDGERERYDFVLHADRDPAKEIRLAFLPFRLLDR